MDSLSLIFYIIATFFILLLTWNINYNIISILIIEQAPQTGSGFWTYWEAHQCWSVECVLFFFLLLSLTTSRPAVTQPRREAVTSKQFPQLARAEVMQFRSGQVRYKAITWSVSSGSRVPILSGTLMAVCSAARGSFSLTSTSLSISAGVWCKLILQEVWECWWRSGVC